MSFWLGLIVGFIIGQLALATFTIWIPHTTYEIDLNLDDDEDYFEDE